MSVSTKNRSKLKLFYWITIAMISTLLVTACGNQQAEEPSQVSVSLNEFSIEPQEVTVPAGQINFSVENAGALEHNFEIEGTDAVVDFVLPAEAKTLETTLLPGTYVMVCTVEGHREAGMVGTLIVEE